MIICNTLAQAKLDAINMLLSEDTKSVTISFDKDEKCWCVETEVFSEEELIEMEEEEE